MTTTTTTEECTLTLADGLKVYTKTWKPVGSPIAQAVLIHGFSDHCNAYYSFPSALAESGIEFFSFDQRGWGRTAPDKAQWGVSGATSQLFADLDELLQLRLQAHPNLPLFLMGHSMGGGIALTYAYSGTYRDKLAGVAVWSPLVDAAPGARPPAFVVAAGRLLAKIFPNQKRVVKLDASAMSRDKEVCKEYSEDPLCHGTGTLLGISEMLSRGEQLRNVKVVGKFPNTLPILVCHGTGDSVADCDASRRFVEMLKVKDKMFKEYDGWYHKMHAEPGEDRVKFSNDIIEWVKERLLPAAVGTPKL